MTIDPQLGNIAFTLVRALLILAAVGFFFLAFRAIYRKETLRGAFWGVVFLLWTTVSLYTLSSQGPRITLDYNKSPYQREEVEVMPYQEDETNRLNILRELDEETNRRTLDMN